jgi:hypothetical protein
MELYDLLFGSLLILEMVVFRSHGSTLQSVARDGQERPT